MHDFERHIVAHLWILDLSCLLFGLVVGWIFGYQAAQIDKARLDEYEHGGGI